MAKLRFTDCEKWRDAWFVDLPQDMKLLWVYLCDNCDNCGVWAVSQRHVDFEMGKHVDLDAALSVMGERVRPLAEGRKWFLTKFISFQYPAGLSDKSSPHRQVLRLLASHGLSLDEKTGGGVGYIKATCSHQDQTRPDQTSQGDARGTVNTASLLVKNGLPCGPKDVTEWAGGLNRVACCRSADEADAFMRWAVAVAKADKFTLNHWRHAKPLAERWDAGERSAHWMPAKAPGVPQDQRSTQGQTDAEGAA